MKVHVYSRLILSCAVALALTAGAGNAAELVIRDVGVEVELPATGYSFTLSDDTGSRSGRDSFTSGYGAGIGARWSFARIGDASGPVLGVALAVDRASYASGGSWASSEVRGQGGWGWAVNDRFAVLAEGLLGLGVARLTVEGNGVFPGFSAKGGLITPGVQAVALWSINERWVASGTLGYRYGLAKLSGDGADIDLTLSGLAVGVGLAWRITDRPFLLE